jgi:hypothetical protein
MPIPRKPLAERWASFVRKTDTCWLWTGPLTKGYGSIGRGGRSKCDVPACVNPAHLFLGTNTDNQRDSIRKGRQAPPEVKSRQGVENGRARLSEADVRAIRAQYVSLPKPKNYPKRGGVTAIARQFGVGAEAVRRIGRGESWSHVA